MTLLRIFSFTNSTWNSGWDRLARKLAFALLCLSSSMVFGQRSQVSEKYLEVSVCSLFRLPDVEFFQKDPVQGYIPFSISYQTRGRYQRVSPRDGLDLFRKGVDENGQSTWIPSLKLPVSSGVDKQLILIYHTMEGRPKMLMIPSGDDTDSAGSVRVANLLPMPVAVRFGTSNRMLNSGQSFLEKPALKEVFPVTYVYESRDGSPIKSSVSHFRLRDARQRLLLLIAPSERQAGDEGDDRVNFVPDLISLYDRVDVSAGRGFGL